WRIDVDSLDAVTRFLNVRNGGSNRRFQRIGFARKADGDNATRDSWRGVVTAGLKDRLTEIIEWSLIVVGDDPMRVFDDQFESVNHLIAPVATFRLSLPMYFAQIALRRPDCR